MGLAHVYRNGSWEPATTWNTNGQIREGKARIGGEWIVFTRQFIENWEDHTLSPYNVGGENAAKSFTVRHEPANAYEGDHYALAEHTTGAGGGSVWAHSTSGLSNYPRAGDTWSGYTRVNQSNAVSAMSYGIQSTADPAPPGYHALIRNGVFALRYTRPSGGGYEMASASFSQSSYLNEWLEVEVYWHPAGGDHTARLVTDTGTEIVSISGRNQSGDPDYTSGGFGFRGGRTVSGAVNVRFDNAYIHS